MLRAELFWSFRSPYSYLATPRYRALCERYNLEIAFRPVYPLAIRQRDFFERNHPNWLHYVLRDVVRLADFLDMPFARPDPDPIVQDLATRRIATEQPHIHRITRMGQAAARRGRGLAYADEVSRLIWGGVSGWDRNGHLASAADRAGLDHGELEAEAQSQAETLDEELAANLQALEQSGHWGVPTLVFDGEPFFGQDRIEIALWRMRQAGLKARRTRSQDGETMTGGCACGRIRYTAEVADDEAYLCHCRMCQRATGSVSVALKTLDRSAVRWEREPDWFQSSAIARRPFCRECGASLGFAYVDSSKMDLTVASFDDPARFRPTAHFGAESLHPFWLETAGLPRTRADDYPPLTERWNAAGAEPPA